MILFKQTKINHLITEMNANTDIGLNIYIKSILKGNCFEELLVLTIFY